MTKIKAMGNYKNYVCKKNSVVEVQFEFDYDNLASVMQSLQFLNNNINIGVIQNEKKHKLGTAMIKKFAVDRDGESVLVLEGMIEDIDTDVINKLVLEDELKIILVKNKGAKDE